MIKALIIAAAIATAVVPALAQQQATPVNGDTRLVTFEYDPDNTYLILTRPKAVTHLQMRPDERVKLAVAGDTANFTVVVSADRNNVLIRPKYEGLNTSLTLITNERSYPIMLRSTPEATGKWYQRVTWNFQDLVIAELSAAEASAEKERRPAEPSADQAGQVASCIAIPLERLHMNYTFVGDAEFRPTHVLDDGTRTYIRFPENLQNLPAVFAVADAEAKIVNFSIDDKCGYVVVQGVSHSMLLKLGKAEVKITKASARRGFFSGAFGG
jgi:type IV secretion system protein VirB9